MQDELPVRVPFPQGRGGGVRFVASKRIIPRSFSRHPHAKGLVAECDIFPLSNGRLAAKLLIFKSPVMLRRFWSKAMGHDLGGKCLGAVNAMVQERCKVSPHRNVPDVSTLVGDPRYFCIIGLCIKYLTMEIVTHEAVHAGYAYAKRVKRNVWGKIGDFDEEQIAYPSGAIADAINRFIHAKQLQTS